MLIFLQEAADTVTDGGQGAGLVWKSKMEARNQYLLIFLQEAADTVTDGGQGVGLVWKSKMEARNQYLLIFLQEAADTVTVDKVLDLLVQKGRLVINICQYLVRRLRTR